MKVRKLCPLCKTSNPFKIIYPGTLKSETFKPEELMITDFFLEHGTIVKCPNCELMFVKEFVTQKELADTYSEVEDPDYVLEETGRQKELERELKRIEKYKNHGDLLDIGCFTGCFLLAAKQKGWNVFGIEPSKWAVNYARTQKNLKNIFFGTIKNSELDRKFDVITMWDVIEHLVNPLQELKVIRNHLKPNGILAISTPNFSSFLWRIFGEKWWFIEKMHLFYFDRKSIRKLLDKAGFNVVKIKRHYKSLSLGYMITKVEPYSQFLYSFGNKFLRFTKLDKVNLKIYLGQMTVIAKKDI
jgi:2-polyprenyl-3-methyl-5-hydroxy-6-metoxy-1,4-benzoquinol methylase